MLKIRLMDYWLRFRGGPDFSVAKVLDAQLENYQLTFNLPPSNISANNPPREVNFPYLEDGWFERNAEHRRQHYWAHIHMATWVYLPVGLLSRMCELGTLRFSVWIKKIQDNKAINAKNLNELGKHLVDEYDSHFNSPVVGDNFLGANTELMQEHREELKEHAPDMSKIRIKEHVKLALEARGFPTLKPHEIKNINGKDWVYYVEHFPRTFSHSRYYSFPLNEQYYLIIRFWYEVNRGENFKLWKKHAEAAEKRIMESVKIESVEPLKLESSQ